jgi:hypothetical protein
MFNIDINKIGMMLMYYMNGRRLNLDKQVMISLFSAFRYVDGI